MIPGLIYDDPLMHVLALALGLTLLLVAVLIVMIVKLSAARELVNVSEDVVALGWPQVAPDDAGWRAFTALASTGSEPQEWAFGQGYRDNSGPYPRFLTLGKRTETAELWIGEARA